MFLRIRFLDHVQNGTCPLLCEVVGLLVNEDEESYTVVSWNVFDTDEETIKINRDSFTILKSTIKEIEELHGKGKKPRKKVKAAAKRGGKKAKLSEGKKAIKKI